MAVLTSKSSNRKARTGHLKRNLRDHLQTLLAFDREYHANQTLVIGIDEVGRGSLIGPVVAGAVCFPLPLTESQEAALQGLDDSKRLSITLRETLAENIPQLGICAIGIASQAEVETLNVYHAAKLAFFRAYENLLSTLMIDERFPQTTHHLLIDGKACLTQLPYHAPKQLRQTAVIKGDSQSASIAAASILAKVYRDNWVKEHAQHHPPYGWETNMGYGTPAHLKAIASHGPTPLHRKTFLKGICDAVETQAPLFS